MAMLIIVTMIAVLSGCGFKKVNTISPEVPEKPVLLATPRALLNPGGVHFLVRLPEDFLEKESCVAYDWIFGDEGYSSHTETCDPDLIPPRVYQTTWFFKSKGTKVILFRLLGRNGKPLLVLDTSIQIGGESEQ
jgi:hypothetical protein